MDSVIINGEEPKLLQLIVWFEAKYEKDTKVTVQVGTRAPLIHNDYMPSNRVYFYDIARRSELPVIQVAYNALKVPIDLSEFPDSTSNTIKNEDFSVCFIYELMNETSKLEQKYWSVKQAEDKISRGEGLTNFVRAESQFITLFERDEDIEQIRAVEIEEEKIEREMSEDIMSLRKAKVEIKIIIVLILLSLIAGYIWRAMQNPGEMGDVRMRVREMKQRKLKAKRNKKYY